MVEWFIQQCLGLVQGLSRVHRLTTEVSEEKGSSKPEIEFGRHGDIKPENILLFSDHAHPNDRGTLVVSDFGLTRFHRSSGGQHREKRITPTYRAPEYDLNRGVTTRAYDIWSLGCLFLEFATWMLTGASGVDDKFTAARTMDGLQEHPDDSYFIIKRDESRHTLRAEIKPSVTQASSPQHFCLSSANRSWYSGLPS
jgi:serine/threonine protein kinase